MNRFRREFVKWAQAERLEDLHAALLPVIYPSATPDLIPRGAMVLQPSEERAGIKAANDRADTSSDGLAIERGRVFMAALKYPCLSGEAHPFVGLLPYMSADLADR